MAATKRVASSHTMLLKNKLLMPLIQKDLTEERTTHTTGIDRLKRYGGGQEQEQEQ
jgi:hypothetical protein